MGLTLQPYWSPGVRIPGPEAKGAIIGFGDVHTRAHLYRAILEGLAYALREGAERTARRTGVPLTSLRLAGGGVPERGGRPADGGRLRAAGGARAHPRDVRPGRGHRCRGRAWACTPTSPAAAAAMVRIGEVRDPDPATHALYDELYRGVYRPMYDRLSPSTARSAGSPATRRDVGGSSSYLRRTGP